MWNADATMSDADFLLNWDSYSDTSDTEMIAALQEVEHNEHNFAEALLESEKLKTDEDLRIAYDGPTTSSSTTRFPQIKDDQLEEIVNNSTSKATNKMTKWGVRVFKRKLKKIKKN